MTPKEKAAQLIGFFDTIQIDHNNNVGYMLDHLTIEERKKCALVVINEILTLGLDIGDYNDFKDCPPDWYASYWEQVKQEIEKL